MTAGLRLVVCLQEAGWNQARRIQQAVSNHMHLLFGEGFCKVHEEPFERGLNCFHGFFSNFQHGLKSHPGLSTLV